MKRRSAAVVLAVVLQRLARDSLGAPNVEEALVLRALRRSKAALATADDQELSEYVRSMSPEQLRGLVSNVKGIYHEMLVQRAECFDDDAVEARLFEATNHPGADLEFLSDGVVIETVQLKAVQSAEAIEAHFSAYPDIDVMVTSEAFAAAASVFGSQVRDSGFANADLERDVSDVLATLSRDGALDGLAHSALIVSALQARAVLTAKQLDREAVRAAVETAGIGIASTIVMEALLG